MIDDIAALIAAQYKTGYVLPCITEEVEYLMFVPTRHVLRAESRIELPCEVGSAAHERTWREYQRIRSEFIKAHMAYRCRGA